MILEFVSADTKDSFCFAQGIELRNSSKGDVLRCRKVYLEDSPVCGELNSAEEAEAFEEFMNKPDEDASLPFDTPVIRRGDTFNVLIRSVDDNPPVDSPCLFSEVTVPDIISHMENGDCSLCNNKGGSVFPRAVYPELLEGQAEKFRVFVSRDVSIVCPLCNGLRLSQEHKELLRDGELSQEQRQEVGHWAVERMAELGYDYYNCPYG